MGVYFVFFKKVHLATDADGKELRFRKRDIARNLFASGFINTLNPGNFGWGMRRCFRLTIPWRNGLLFFRYVCW